MLLLLDFKENKDPTACFASNPEEVFKFFLFFQVGNKRKLSG